MAWEHTWDPAELMRSVRGRGATKSRPWRPQCTRWTCSIGRRAFRCAWFSDMKWRACSPEISALCDTHVRIPMLGSQAFSQRGHGRRRGDLRAAAEVSESVRYCATIGLVPATAPPAPEARFHALALARAPGALHPRSVPLFRCHADHSAGAGGVPRVFRRTPDGSGPAGRAGAHHRRWKSAKSRGTWSETLSRRGSWRTRISRAWRRERRREFAAAARARAGARGSAPIPAEPEELRQTMARVHGGRSRAKPQPPMAICSPLRRRTSAPRADGNRTAPPTAMLRPEHRDRTFVILATSHYGEPEKFGLTRKKFRTPLGEARTDDAAGGLAGRARRRRHRDGRLLPLLRAHRGAAGDLPAARAGAGGAHSADSVRIVRAQPFRKAASPKKTTG